MRRLLAVMVCLAAAGSAPAATCGEYKTTLATFKTYVANVSDKDYYENNFKFTDKKTDKIKKFSEFSAEDQQQIFLMLTERLVHRLEDYGAQLDKDLKAAPVAADAALPEDERPAAKADVERAQKDLKAQRKALAVTWEKLATETFKKFPKMYTDKEKDQYLRDLKAYNDKHQLAP